MWKGIGIYTLHMNPLHDSRLFLTKIDEQIIRLLQDRAQQCVDLSDSGDAITEEEESEILSYWLEEAADLELDEGIMEKICKLVLLLSRKNEE